MEYIQEQSEQSYEHTLPENNLYLNDKYCIYLDNIIEENIFGKIVEGDYTDEEGDQIKIVAQLVERHPFLNDKIIQYRSIYTIINQKKSFSHLLQPLEEQEIYDQNYCVFIFEYYKENILQFRQKQTNIAEKMLFQYIRFMINSYKEISDQGLIHGCIIPENIVFNLQNQLKIKNIFTQKSIYLYQELFKKFKSHGQYFPENIKKNLNLLSEKTDFYSLGIIFYQILFLELPKFDGQNIIIKNEIQDKNIIELIQKMIKQEISMLKIFDFKPQIKYYDPYIKMKQSTSPIDRILFERNKIILINQIVTILIKYKEFFEKKISEKKQILGSEIILKSIYLLLEKQRIMYNQLIMNMITGRNIDGFEDLKSTQQFSQLKNLIVQEATRVQDFISEKNLIQTIYNNNNQDKNIIDYITSNDMQRSQYFEDAYKQNLYILIDSSQSVIAHQQPEKEILLFYLYLLYGFNIEQECRWDEENGKYFDFKSFYAHHQSNQKLSHLILDKFNQILNR